MLKKLGFALIVLVFCSFLYAQTMTVEIDMAPTSANLGWNGIDGTVYYDIYMDNSFVERLDATSNSYKVEHLKSEVEYTFIVASRDKDNNTLASAAISGKTDSWDGVYLWKNLTDNDNNGKMKSFQVRVETKLDPVYGQFYYIYYIDADGKEFRIFPLFDFDDKKAFEWHKLKENSIAGNSYRRNAELFNTSSFKPGKWKVYSIVIDRDTTTAYIQTSALGMEFMTETEFILYEDENGDKHISLDTRGEQKIVDNYLFKNPNPGEGDMFILNKIN